jgi:hypothetical protein
VAVGSNTVIRNSIAAWLVLEGEDLPIDISAVRIKYGVNEIPTADGIRVMVGNNITEKTTVAGVESKLRQHKRIDIRFAVLNKAGGIPSEASPGGATYPKKAYVDTFPPKVTDGIIIFRGTISSVNKAKNTSISGNSASYVLNAVGFLNALAGVSNSTKFYEVGELSSPHRAITYLSKFLQDTSASLADVLQSKRYLDRFPEIQEDLWKNGISEILYAAAAELTKSGGVDKSTEILKSETQSEVGAQNGNLGDNAVKNPAWMSSNGNDKLSFASLGVNISTGSRFSQTLVAQLEDSAFKTLISQNAWEAIIGMTNTFHIALIPTIEAYAVVPLNPAISGDAFVKIYADEYMHINEMYSVSNPLRRVILRSQAAQTQAVAGGPRGAPDVLGVYPPKGQSPFDTGTITAESRTVQVPIWLDQSCAMTPYVPKNAVISEKERTTQPTLDYLDIAPGNLYAKMVYFKEVFGSGGVTIEGRLRFDIGPGSLVEVEGLGTISDPTAESDSSIFGIIDEALLDIEIEGQSGTAGTAFTIRAVRSKDDHENKVNTSEVHPIYLNSWRGCPLMQDPGTLRT